jgi:hypothetical protein
MKPVRYFVGGLVGFFFGWFLRAMKDDWTRNERDMK